MQILSPTHWKDYELLDCGNFEKLERFGQYILRRPEPQAVWNKQWAEKKWEEMSDARFSREKKEHYRDGDKGGWKNLKNMPESWNISYSYEEMHFNLRLALTSFGHIGVFPEQAENWNFIFDHLKQFGKDAKVLNLFAYTGGASLAAKAAGADVVHLDAVKQTVNWARSNMEISQMNDIRWVIEDAMKFVERETKRGKKYQGIILDPPAYGRGPKGEKWVLEEGINDLMAQCSQLLEDKDAILVANLYSMGLSALVIENLVRMHFGVDHTEFGEFYLQAQSGSRLPLGTFARFKR